MFGYINYLHNQEFIAFSSWNILCDFIFRIHHDVTSVGVLFLSAYHIKILCFNTTYYNHLRLDSG